MTVLRIAATSHGHNYLPEYLADASGAFARRGLEVRSWPRDPWTGVIDDLDAGEADLVLGGIWGAAMYTGRGRDLVAVGQVNDRCSKEIVTREPVEDFDWSWIEGRTILAPGAGGTAPYEFTAGLIRRAGVDPASARFVRDLSGQMLTELFEAGLGDAIILDTFSATQLSLRGGGHRAYRMAGPGGRMPNSVYYTYRDRLDDLHDRLAAFLGGLQEAMDAIADGTDLEPLLAEHWPTVSPDARTSATAELIANGTWDGVAIDADATNAWMEILQDAGLVAPGVGYEQLVDTRALDASDAGARVVPSP